MRHVSDFGILDVPEGPKRPNWLPVSESANMVALSVFISTRMSLACHRIDLQDDLAIKKRIEALFLDIGDKIERMKISDEVRSHLINPKTHYLQEFINIFNDGWSDSTPANVELMWRLNAAQWVVDTILFLHACVVSVGSDDSNVAYRPSDHG
jgi:hypothetical protein